MNQNKIWCNSKAGVEYEHNSFKNTAIKFISQGFLEDDIVWIRCRYFDLKIHASSVANTLYRLHNDKYTKYSHNKHCIIHARVGKSQMCGYRLLK